MLCRTDWPSRQKAARFRSVFQRLGNPSSRRDGLPIRGKRNSRRDAFRGWANPSYIQRLFIVVLSLKSRFIRLQLQVLNESFRYDLMQRGILGWDNHDGWGDPPVFDPDIIANGDTEEFANHGLKSAADGGLL